MRRVVGSLLLVLAAGCTSLGGAQPSAWRAGGLSCVAAPAANGAADPATGCPIGIDRPGSDFSALDALTRPAGPHRYALEGATTSAERRGHPTACCYTLEYPPPPPG